MKKELTIFFFLMFFVSFAQYKKDISFQILNSVAKENQNIKIAICNNSNKNYYILLDTLFFEDAKFESDTFFNPYFILTDKNGESPIEIANIIENTSHSDISYFNKITDRISFIEIKSKQKYTFEIPFKVNREMNRKLNKYYIVNRNERYFLQIKYLVKEEFLTMKFIEDLVINIQNKEHKIFTGVLYSKKIPVEFIKQ